MALYGRTTLAKLAAGVNESKSFKAGNVSGKLLTQNPVGYAGYTGWLPANWDQQLRDDVRNGDVYVVYSYQTPIAWRTSEGWIQPPVKYSPSSTGHQSAVAAEIGGYSRNAWHQPARTIQPSTMADFSARDEVADFSVPARATTRAIPDTDHDTANTRRILDAIDQMLADVAADGWTNPYTDTASPARRLA